MEHPYHITNGMLSGPEGSWQLSKISSVYKKTGSKLSLKKWLIFVAAISVTTAASTGPLFAVPLTLGAMAYFVHETKRVYIVMDGLEVELYSVIYILSIPHLSEDQANMKCDALVNLIRQNTNK